MRKLAVIAVCLVSAAWAGESSNHPVVTAESARTFYQDFTRLTAAPHYVSLTMVYLCVAPDQATIEAERKRSGPHVDAAVHIYANPIAEAARANGWKSFATGAVVVKEKLPQSGTAAGVGGMIKREAGYFPAGGDWEYFYADAAVGFTTGRLQNCAACHAGAKPTDFVFGGWRMTPETSGK